MKNKPLFTLLAALLMAAFVLAACQPAAPEATEAPEPTEAMVEPTEEMAFEPMSLAADSCDYGGKISSVEAVDELTVKFTLCKP
ncbi:MAG TPA: hypothetical protein VMN57_17430, partial [Anaerolineales bacterium]|nr:hypothetical protein [Anaerolineales bacterium]